MAKRRTNTSALNGVAMDINAGVGERTEQEGLRVQPILINLVRPDPAQPRRVLPEFIHQRFHDEEITPGQALSMYIHQVQIIAQEKGRPFQSITDFLVEEEIPANLTAEERNLRDLVTLAVTLRDDAQINPLTVFDRSQGAARIYPIETGERRYWAQWLQMDFLPGYQGDGTIPCVIVTEDRRSVFRQAKENSSRSGLNAVAMARQAGLLVLAAHDKFPPLDGVVPNEFYRQALDLDLRGKREYADEILAAMGGIKKGYFSYIKALLGLSDEALELADRHDLDEYRLRPVLKLPQDYHADVVRQIIDLRLNGAQVDELVTRMQLGEALEEAAVVKIPKAALKVASIIQKPRVKAEDVAKALLLDEKHPARARAKLNEWRALLDDIESHLQ